MVRDAKTVRFKPPASPEAGYRELVPVCFGLDLCTSPDRGGRSSKAMAKLAKTCDAHPMTRILAYVSCLAALMWLVVGQLHLRESLRTTLRDAYSLMGRVIPDHTADAGKVMNSYYESIYRNLPSVMWPVGILIVCSTILLKTRTTQKTGRSAGSNVTPSHTSH